MPDDKTAEVLQPCEEPFDFPAEAVTLQWAAILRSGTLLPVRGNHFDTPILTSMMPLTPGMSMVDLYTANAKSAARAFEGLLAAHSGNTSDCLARLTGSPLSAVAGRLRVYMAQNG